MRVLFYRIIILILSPIFTHSANDTDTKWNVTGAEVKINSTELNPTKVNLFKEKHVLHVGGLFDLDSHNGAGTLSAAMMALEEINKSTKYLKDYRIILHHERSTKGLLSEGTRVLYDYLHKEPAKIMLLGPFNNDLAKTVAAYAGLPEIGILQFSYGATDLELASERNRYPLFYRTVPTELVFNEPRLQFIRYFGWTDEIGLIYDTSPYYAQINKHLADSLARNGSKVVANEGFTKDPTVAVKSLKEKGAHIIVGTFHHSRAKKVFCQAYLSGMYGENYVWLLTSVPDVNITSNWWVPSLSDKLPCTRSEMEEALDHHFTFYYNNRINGTLVSGKTTEQFFEAYNKRIPPIFRSVHAPFAYEAMWAIAATLKRARPILEGWGMELHTLGYGRRLVSQLLKEEARRITFRGPSGDVTFSENGNRQCRVYIQQFRKNGGTREVGVYDHNPPNLILRGESRGNITPIVLDYVQWPAGKPYQRISTIDSWLYIKFPLFISWTLVSGFLLVCCVVCLAMLLVFRRHRVIGHSGFYLSQALILGCILNLFSVVLFGIDGSLVSFETLQWVCKARTWALSLGFTLCLGSLLPRVLFAYRVVSWRPQKIKKVPWSWMHVTAFVMFIGDIALLVTWHIVFSPRAIRTLREIAKPRPYQERPLLIEQCVSNNEARALALLFIPKGMLLIIGALAAWPGRRLCMPLCNNTRNCALCLGIAAVMCIIEVPIIVHVREYPNPFFAITGLVIIVLTAALLVLGMVPQLKRAQKCEKEAQCSCHGNSDRESIQESNGGPCNCHVCVNPKDFRPQLASCTGPHSCAPVCPDWDFLVSGVPNRKKEEESRIVTEIQTVYVDAPAVPTVAAHTQTMAVASDTTGVQTLVVRTQSAAILTEQEPEVEHAEVIMQTEAEEPTPVFDADTQTAAIESSDIQIQTEKAVTTNSHVQTLKTQMTHSEAQTDIPLLLQEPYSEESDTASIASSRAESPRPERKAKGKRFQNIRSRVDTNLSSKQKDMIAKAPTTAQLRVTHPTPYNSYSKDYLPVRSPRSRDPSPRRQ